MSAAMSFGRQTNTASISDINQIDENELVCSITQEVPHDPVLGSDGQIYEKSAIQSWLSKKQISPVTKDHMTVDDLKVCPTIRTICQLIHTGKISFQKDKEKTALCVEDNRNKTSIQKTANIKGFPSAYSGKDEKLIFTFNALQGAIYSPKNINQLQWSDIVLCLDISYSTSELVQSKDESGEQIEGKYTINDTIRHGAKTAVYAIKNTGSRISVYQFDNSVEIVVPLTQVTDDNIDSIVEKINSMRPRGGTNIYKPIQHIIKDLSERTDQSRNAAILLLTDGMPNHCGSYSEEEGAVRLYKKLGVFYPIYTFGFGYSLKKGLMYNIAQKTGGVNSHIPDGSFVATVFSNALANILNTCCYNLRLHLKIPIVNNDTHFKLDIVDSDYEVEMYEDLSGKVREVSILIGCLQFEQKRDIIINVENTGPNSIIEYKYSYSQGNNNIMSKSIIIKDIESFGNVHENMEFELLRNYVCKMMGKMYVDRERNLSTTSRSHNVEMYVRDRDLQHDKSSKLLMETWMDQVYLANVSTEIEHNGYWGRWGWIYFDQLRSAIKNQCSNNFKDKAYECFGGKLCRDTSDAISDAFDTIPNTDPTGDLYPQYGNTSRSLSNSAPSAPISQMNYSENSCFTCDSLITMSDGSMKQMKDLRPGDEVISVSIQENPNLGEKFGINNSSKVVSILQSRCNNSLAKIVQLTEHCKVTDWHPVSLVGTVGSCKFPININNSKNIHCEFVYSIVLEPGKHFTVMDDGILGITLGTNLTKEQCKHDKILSHNFWGTDSVRSCLKKHKNYPYVDIHPGMIVRNGKMSEDGTKEVSYINI